MKFYRGQTVFFISSEDSPFYTRFLGQKVSIQDYSRVDGKYLIRFSDRGVTWVYEHQLATVQANDPPNLNVSGASNLKITPEEEALILRRRQANAGIQQYNEGLECAAQMAERQASVLAPGGTQLALEALVREIRAVKLRLR